MTEKNIPPIALTNPQFKADLDQCIHCGLCLQACPTYVVSRKETDSPRGRIQLMRAAASGRVGLGGAVQEHIGLCLACRSCESACPSGVQYGSLVQTTRIAIEQARKPSLPERAVRWLALRQGMPHLGRLRWMGRFMRIYQRIGLQALVRRLNILPGNLGAMEALLPPLDIHYVDYSHPAPAIGTRRGAVAFFYGCIQDAFLSGVNAATVRVLQRNGYDVYFPQSQTCCGAAQLHVGEEELARELARKNIDAFASLPRANGGGTEGGGASLPRANGGGTEGGGAGYDAIIDNAGGCGAVLKEYAHLLANDPQYAQAAKEFVAKMQDVTEFLAGHLNCPPRGEVKARVTYSDSCHLRHAQRVIRQPRDLIRAIPGIEFVELKAPELCCGSAGVYNIVQPEMANAVLDRKMEDIAATGADTVVATNTGCHLQLIYGVRKAGLNARVVHLVELLDESYRNEAK